MAKRKQQSPQSKLVIDRGEPAGDLSLDEGEGLSLEGEEGLGALDGGLDSLEGDTASLDLEEPPDSARKEHPLPKDLEDLHGSFSARAKAEQNRFELVTDSEYWFCICFQSREQCLAFLEAKGWLTETNDSDKYLDGLEVARLEGVELPAVQVPFVPQKPDPALNNLSLPLKKPS